MGVHLVVPEVSLSTSLLTELERNNDCLFAVAYLTLEGVRLLSEVIDRRLDASRFSLRVVCCVSDFITDPEALEELHRLGQRRAGKLKLRWHGQVGFHVKAYGFRKSGRTTVFTGSWNVTGKALGADSGELGVAVSSSAVAEEGWATLERFWDGGNEVTPSWLREYKTQVERFRERSAPARKIVNRWRKKFRGRRRSSVTRVVTGTSLYFEHVVPIGRDDKERVERARKDARQKHDLETANGWICYENRAEALAVPRDRDILQVHWRSSTTSSKGARFVMVVRLRGAPIRVVDPETGSAIWLLYFNAIRGMRALIKKPQHDRATTMLRRNGITWSTLWNMKSGFLRARRKVLLGALRNLKRL